MTRFPPSRLGSPTHCRPSPDPSTCFAHPISLFSPPRLPHPLPHTHLSHGEYVGFPYSMAGNALTQPSLPTPHCHAFSFPRESCGSPTVSLEWGHPWRRTSCPLHTTPDPFYATPLSIPRSRCPIRRNSLTHSAVSTDPWPGIVRGLDVSRWPMPRIPRAISRIPAPHPRGLATASALVPAASTAMDRSTSPWYAPLPGHAPPSARQWPSVCMAMPLRLHGNGPPLHGNGRRSRWQRTGPCPRMPAVLEEPGPSQPGDGSSPPRDSTRSRSNSSTRTVASPGDSAGPACLLSTASRPPIALDSLRLLASSSRSTSRCRNPPARSSAL